MRDSKISIAFFDFNNLQNMLTDNSDELVVKPEKPFWRSVKVSENKSIVIKNTDSEVKG